MELCIAGGLHLACLPTIVWVLSGWRGDLVIQKGLLYHKIILPPPSANMQSPQWIILILGRPAETSQAFCNEASCCLHLSVHDRDGTLQRRALSCNRIPLAQIFCMLRKPEWDCHYIITMHLWEVATKNTCVWWGSHITGNRGEEELAFTCNVFKCVPSKRITDNKPCGERPII